MIEWSLISEYFALILTVITAIFFYDPQAAPSKRRNLFRTCLALAAASVVINIACVYTLNAATTIPLWVNVLMNSLYFLVSMYMSITIGAYIIDRLFEYVYTQFAMKLINFILIALLVFSTAIVLWNLESGVLFYFDDAMNYCRGALNPSAYAVPVCEVIVVAVCYLRYRKSVSQQMKRVVLAVPTVTVMLVGLQMLYPEQLVNGTIAAIANLIAFVGFQSCRIERDALTGVANRQSFSSELTLRTRGAQHYQVLLVALRNFSQVNQVYGHASGDALLFQVAQALRGACDDAQVFRFNSVEFALLMPEAGGVVQNHRTHLVQQSLSRPWVVGNHTIQVRFCVADLRYHGQPWTPEQVSNFMEYTIALAKQNNNEVLLFDEGIEHRYQKQKDMVRKIQSAIDGHRVRVWYQPVFYRESKHFESAEALMRIYGEDGVRIAPNEFIPVAEQFGLLDELTWVALDQVCALLGSGDVPQLHSVSINLSMRQLLEPDLKKRIQASMEKHGVRAEQLKLEVTEREIADNSNLVNHAMEDMRKLGLEFFMDDFGTGYSNFSAAMDLPFSVVKFDRSLVSGIVSDKKSHLTVETLLPFFHKLGKTVLAEGIETEEEANMAFDLGVDRIQGFFYARPMPKDKLIEFYDEYDPKAE